MSTRLNWRKIGIAVLLSSALLCTGIPTALAGTSGQNQRKATAKKKKPELPPLPSGPTGRQLPAMPLDAIAAVPPQVTYENNQLTINAPNSTLGDILRAVRKLTGAEIEIPAAPERVVTHLGPGPAREVVAELLNGSRFNYVLLGSPTDQSALTRVVLVAKAGVQEVPSPGPVPNAAMAQPTPAEPEATPEGNEADASADDSGNNADENADQPSADAEQQQGTPEQAPGVKTPQQMLQEMQQRQMQLQQQGQQPPVPNQGSGMQPHPPQEN